MVRLGPVTIVMPLKAHDRRLLDEALDSVAAQSAPAWRLSVVVEPDELERFRQLLAARLEDPRVTLLANEGQRMAGAINTGARRAETPFVALLFADDMLAPDAIAVLSERIAAHPDADFFHSGRVIVDTHGAEISPRYEPVPQVRPDDFLTWGPVKHLLCWRRELGLAVGGIDEALDSVGPDDYDFPWTMAEAGACFQPVPECLYLYRDHRECFRLTIDQPRSVHRRGIRRVMEKHSAPEDAIQAHLKGADDTYLRQCLNE